MKSRVGAQSLVQSVPSTRSNEPGMISTLTLTSEQRAIVEAPDGHYLINAVAGSGKTTTLAYRIRHLLERGEDPRRIVVLMFNKAAQLEFVSKLKQIIPQTMQIPEVRTFHAMGYRLYQRFAAEGVLSHFSPRILSEREIQYMLWQITLSVTPKHKLSQVKRNKKEHLEQAFAFCEAVKAQMQSPEALLKSLKLGESFDYLPTLFHQFESWRGQQSRISYADMLYDPVRAIAQSPELTALVSNKVNMILVDEYQDTNDIQHELLTYVAGTRAKVTVVGDPDQTIYEFRGAKPEYMQGSFVDQFEDVDILNLNYSFRYGHQISLMANHLIQHNQRNDGTFCLSHHSTPKSRVRQIRASNTVEACLAFLDSNSRASDAHDFAQIAILMRVWSQSYALELALLKYEIPYDLKRQTTVFESEPYLLLEHLLELVSGQFKDFTPAERERRFTLFMRLPHVGLPESDTRPIAQALATRKERWGIALLELIPSDIKVFQSKKLEQLAYALSTLETRKLPTKKAFVTYLEQCGLYDGIRSVSLTKDQAEEKISALGALVDYIGQLHESPMQALTELAMLKQRQSESPRSGLVLTTIHRAKGLEWDTVLIPDFDDQHYPYQLSETKLTQSEIESERRLLYVATTRAKQTLVLISPEIKGPGRRSRFEKEFNLKESREVAAALNQGVENKTDLKPGCSEISLHYLNNQQNNPTYQTDKNVSDQGESLASSRMPPMSLMAT